MVCGSSMYNSFCCLWIRHRCRDVSLNPLFFKSIVYSTLLTTRTIPSTLQGSRRDKQGTKLAVKAKKTNVEMHCHNTFPTWLPYLSSPLPVNGWVSRANSPGVRILLREWINAECTRGILPAFTHSRGDTRVHHAYAALYVDIATEYFTPKSKLLGAEEAASDWKS